MVPKRQLMILNFDEWTASDEAAQASMGDVAQFLQLSHFEFRVSEAHNTHANRSVGATHQRPGTYSGRALLHACRSIATCLARNEPPSITSAAQPPTCEVSMAGAHGIDCPHAAPKSHPPALEPVLPQPS